MCFSAPASFAASAGLVALGGVSLKTAKKEDKILAAIPFLFGIQQAFEGVQWLYLNAGSRSLYAAFGFLFFAYIVWPIYVPSAAFMLDKKERRISGWFLLVGVAVAAYFFWLLLTQVLVVEKINSCISYGFNFPLMSVVVVAYVIAVLGPLLFSSFHIMRWFGVAIGLFALISWYFFAFTFTSVWCFFAAIVSSMFLFYVYSKKAG